MYVENFLAVHAEKGCACVARFEQAADDERDGEEKKELSVGCFRF